MEAGVGQITTALLRSFFCHELIHPPTGFLLKGSEGQDIRLHFTFSMLLADGAAQKQVWSSKGDSGPNVRASGTTEDQMHCNITKYSQLVLTSDAEVLQSYAKLDAKKTQCTKAEFDMWQQATGWNHSSKALLLDQDLKSMGQLRPCSQFAHDYMHSILQGVAPIVLYQWLCAMEEGFQVWSGLEAYFQFWVFPRAWKCQHVGTYFSKKKMTSHKNNQKASESKLQSV